MTGPVRIAAEMSEETAKHLGGVLGAVFGKGGAIGAANAGKAAGAAGGAGGGAGGAAAKAAGSGGGKKMPNRILDTIKRNKGKTLLAGGGALALLALSRGGGDDAEKTLIDAADSLGIPDASNISGSGASPFSSQETIEVDPEVMAKFTAELRSAAETLTQRAAAMPGLIENVKMAFATDGDGVPTQDGQPSPGIEDLYAALDGTLARYQNVVRGITNGLNGVAAQLDRNVAAFMDVQESSAKTVDNIDTTMV